MSSAAGTGSPVPSTRTEPVSRYGPGRPVGLAASTPAQLSSRRPGIGPPSLIGRPGGGVPGPEAACDADAQERTAATFT